MRGALIIAAGLIAFWPGVKAQEVRTVRDLLQDCTAELGMPQALLCGGVVEGMAQVLIWNCVSRDYGWQPDPAVVAGSPPNIGAAIEAFVDWATAHPEQWNEEWQLGLSAALAEAFPCPYAAPGT